MHPQLSAFLDVARLAAALTVFLGHAAVRRNGGGFLWQFNAYGDAAVMVFFVLSGFVIAWVVETRERTGAAFVAGRLSRLWSVMLPAIVLTLAIDALGARIAPALLAAEPWYQDDHPVLRPLASALFLNETWGAALHPGSNLPFWSLGYEGMYYALFAVVVFVRSPLRWWLAAALCAIAGPHIAVLAPVWLAGVAIQRGTPWLRRHVSLPAAAFAVIVGAITLFHAPWLEAHASVALPLLDARTVPRWLVGGGFALVLAALCARPELIPAFPERMRERLARAASITFPLYLFHAPILHLLVYLGPEDPASWARRALLIVGTLVIVIVLTPLTDRLRIALRGRIGALFGAPRKRVTAA